MANGKSGCAAGGEEGSGTCVVFVGVFGKERVMVLVHQVLVPAATETGVILVFVVNSVD
ncbi:MAG: hypothetical protein ACK4ND_10490 [Cytophagaceae bacterium]